MPRVPSFPEDASAARVSVRRPETPERFIERGRRHQALGYVQQFAALLSSDGTAGVPGPR